MKAGSAIIIPWTKEGRLRFVELLHAVVEDRKVDRERGNDSVENAYMREVKKKMDEDEPDRKRQKLTKDEEDVEMPVLDFDGEVLTEV